MGAPAALVFSTVPPSLGFALILLQQSPVAIAIGAERMTAWEPRSVLAAFVVVGSEVPKHRRVLAFALRSIQ